MSVRTRSWKGVAAALIASAALAGCGTGEAEESSALQTAEVERRDMRITAEATGSVEPVRTVEVKSKAGGEILALHVDVGDEVEPGDLLAEVDPRDVRNAFEQAEADLEVAEARAAIAEKQLDRQRLLYERSVITEQELESAQLEQANAQSSLIKAERALELARLQLQDVTIRAPMSGTILAKQVEEGTAIQSASSNVSGGTVLFTMANLDSMQVRTLVDETDMGEIQPGMSADVQVEAFPDRNFRGMVAKIEPQAVVQQNVTMFPVIISLENRSGLLRPGMNAEVEVLIDQASDVLVVPNGAVVNLQDVGPAALALGLDMDAIDLTQFRGTSRFAGRFTGRGGAGGGEGAGSGEAASGGENAPARAGGGRSGRGGDRSGLADRFGDLSRDSIRTLMRNRMGGGDFQQGQREVRNAAVFVVDSLGRPAPKMIQIGLSDWDVAQVVGGLEEGDQVAVVGAAQLQANQQEFLERMRNRRGGGPFGR